MEYPLAILYRNAVQSTFISLQILMLKYTLTLFAELGSYFFGGSDDKKEEQKEEQKEEKQDE